MVVITKRPKCSVADCNIDAIVLVHKRFLCGEHLIQLDRKQQEVINKFVEEF